MHSRRSSTNQSPRWLRTPSSWGLAAQVGQTIALTRPAGLKASRLVLAASGRAGLAAGKAALASALGALSRAQRRTRRSASLALTLGWLRAWSEQAVLAVAEAVYVYRHTSRVPRRRPSWHG